MHPGSGEFRDGEGAVHQPILSEEQPDGVFVEDEVEGGDLADLEIVRIRFGLDDFREGCGRGAGRNDLPVQRNRIIEPHNRQSHQYPCSPLENHAFYYMSSHL